MGLLRRYAERSSIENPAVPLTSTTFGFLDGTAALAGPTVTEATALTISHVWRARDLIAGTAASLPLKAYKDGTRETAPARLLDRPAENWTSFEFWDYAFASALLWGNFYARIERSNTGQIGNLVPLHPSWVQVGRKNGVKVFQVNEPDKQRDKRFDNSGIFHVPGIGYDGITGASPIRLMRQSLSLALSAEEYAARMFSSGTMLGGVLQTEQRLDQTAANSLKQNWRQKMTGLGNAHEIAVLDSGAKYQPIGIEPNDAQMIESRRFQVNEGARWFGIPPHMLYELEKSTSWGTGIEQQSIGFVVYSLRTWLSRFEQRITRDITPLGTFAKFKVEGLLRGDSAQRAAYYRTMREVGAFSANDIRALEDLPPLTEGGDTYLQPANLSPLGSDPQGDTNGATSTQNDA